MNFLKSLKSYLKYLSTKWNRSRKKIFFYSEGQQYTNYLFDILKNLNDIDKYEVAYFTSDPNDDININNVKSFYLGKGLVRIIFFTLLKSDLMIMTLTDLGNYEIKKSKKCKNYGYIFHSLMSVFKGYNKNAFINYDIIFSNGKYQNQELELMEKTYKFNKKKIYPVGYSYIENLKRKAQINNSNGSILFAPSWISSKEDLLEKYGLEIIANLLKINKVIFRPHPQSLIKSKEEIKKIENKFKDNKNFFFNKNIGKIESLNKSQILITDNGGIAMEYYILYKRPIISINFKDKIHNVDYQELQIEALEDKFKKKFTKNIKESEIKNLEYIVNDQLKNFSFQKNNLESFLEGNGIILNNVPQNTCDVIKKII